MTITLANLRDGYVYLAQHVLRHGNESSPREMRTKEILGAQLVIENPLDVLPTGIGRKVSVPFAAVEALQLIAQSSRPDLTRRINPNVAQFMDGDSFYGAYGPRVDWVAAYNRLKLDGDSRQAVGLIWRHEDAITTTRDLPCTIALQWVLRRGRLHAFTYMRSNDVWWGLAYDAFQFTQLQATIARLMGVEVGLYVHNATSLHLYERDWDKVEELATTGGRLTDYPEGFLPEHGMTEYDVLHEARLVLDDVSTFNEEVSWWRNQLHG